MIRNAIPYFCPLIILLPALSASAQPDPAKVQRVIDRTGPEGPPDGPAGLTALEDMIREFPKDPDYRWIRARVLWSAKPNEALAEYTRAIELCRGGSRLYCERGTLNWRCGNAQAAIDDVSKALSEDSRERDGVAQRLNDQDRNRAHLVRGVCYGQLSRDAEAIADLTAADQANARVTASELKLPNTDLLCLLKTRGEAYMRTRQYGKSLRDYDRALALKPKDGEALKCRGYCHMSLGHLELARRDLVDALEQRPNDAGVWHPLGGVRAIKGDFEGAAACIRRAVKLEPLDPSHTFALVLILAESGKPDEGATELAGYIKRCPESLMARCWRSGLLFRTGQSLSGTFELFQTLPRLLSPTALLGIRTEGMALVR